jgi:glycosyltransferase involved in cell wall biosynthesis
VRVAFVVRGGVDRSETQRVIPAILGLIGRLAARHDLHVFALHHEHRPCTYRLRGATVHDLGRLRAWKGVRRHRQAARLLAALREIGTFDLVHAYWAQPAGLAATAAARRLGVPAIVTADSGEWVSMPEIDYGLQRRWIDRRAVAATMHRAAMVTVCTAFMAGLAAANGVEAAIVPIGVAPPAGVPVRPAPPPWRLIHVASINRVKDHTTLLRALRRVVTVDPRVHLDVVGEDTLNGAAQRAADELGIRDHVTFHGFLPSAAVADLYALAHLHVVSSRHEAAGVAVLEAAAAGVPTVGTRVGYVSDWAPAERAIAVPVGDPDALGDAILLMLHDGSRRARVAERARAWTLTHDADWTAVAFDRLYRAVVSGR